MAFSFWLPLFFLHFSSNKLQTVHSFCSCHVPWNQLLKLILLIQFLQRKPDLTSIAHLLCCFVRCRSPGGFTLSVPSQRNGGLFGNHLMNGGHRRSNGHQTNATQRPLQVQPPPHYAHMEQPVGRLSRANAMSHPNHHHHHHHHHHRHHNSYGKSPKSTNINLNNANMSSLPNGGHHRYYEHAPPNGYPGHRSSYYDYDKPRTPQGQRYQHTEHQPFNLTQKWFEYSMQNETVVSQNLLNGEIKVTLHRDIPHVAVTLKAKQIREKFCIEQAESRFICSGGSWIINVTCNLMK